MERVGRHEALDLVLLQRLADRLEELAAMFLDQRFEEGQPQDLALALVDTGSEIIVNVFAEQVALEERAAAVGFHEQLDGRFLHGLATEDLGDDALHLAAIPE